METKNPYYSLFVKELNLIFPNAKFIHMVRDARDTVVSYKGVDFDVNSTSALAHRWNRYNRAILENIEKDEKRAITLRYEDFINDPQSESKRICSFLGVEYLSQMLTDYQRENDWVGSWREHVNKPIFKNKIYRWKKEMSENDLKLTNYVCSDLLNHFGYASDKKFSWRIKGRAFLGALGEGVFTFFEKLSHRMPIKMIHYILLIYRTLTKTIQKENQQPSAKDHSK